jgi:uncharacterized protein YciI
MAPHMHAVLIEHAAGWDDARGLREQDGWDEHAAFMDALVDDGFVVLGGPIGEGDGENTLLIVAAPDEQAARTRLAADPWFEGALTIASIRAWTVWLRARAS